MKFAEQIERLQKVDKLIRNKSTGPPDELARNLGVSRSQLYNIISFFNELGVEVKYSKSSASFYYLSDKEKIEINFSVKIISENNAYKIYGSGTGRASNKFCINYQ